MTSRTDDCSTLADARARESFVFSHKKKKTSPPTVSYSTPSDRSFTLPSLPFPSLPFPSRGKKTPAQPPRDKFAVAVAARLLVLRAVLPALEAKDQEQHEDDEQHAAAEHELHLQVLPPHLPPERPPRPVKVIRLEPQVLRLVHEKLSNRDAEGNDRSGVDLVDLMTCRVGVYTRRYGQTV